MVCYQITSSSHINDVSVHDSHVKKFVNWSKVSRIG